MDVELEKLQQQWDACKAQDDEKHSLISALLSHIESQSSHLSEAISDLDEKKLVIRVTCERTQQLEAQIQEMKLEKFRNDLVQAGLDGGKQAISLLKQSVEQKMKALDSTVPHLQVIVRVYANLKGLTQAYQTAGILSSGETLEAFVRGFNMGDPLCDYVDAGNGKECADEKVKGKFPDQLQMDSN
ncbi:hypothetical protein NW762_011742 [Fusarium torreyae]|uniref:DUF7923 domain-containing protein n=1 Tax=Fusarium torreyae TaxID=1237075 RepID=A0A9W8RRP9_9HYPO|nr:hypothetical protein NW762_011742 [Fusarium torreyae]